MTNRSFPSKILLFGEYSVINDPKALCISYPLFDGLLKFKTNKAPSPDSELLAFISYLKFLKDSGRLPIEMDFHSLDFDIAQGLCFDSTIPQGFGVGSSGAVTAAIYECYAKHEPEKVNILRLKKIFSVLESHFHESSSGLDPLVSFLGKSVLINGHEDLSVVNIPHFPHQEGAIFLLNTGRPRKTGPLVNLFLEKYHGVEFDRRYKEELLPITNLCITHFLQSNREGLAESFRDLSLFQYDCFAPMIPPLFKDLWKKGLTGHDYYLKLCGAGGGGFLLGFAKNFENLETVLKNSEIRPVVRV